MSKAMKRREYYIMIDIHDREPGWVVINLIIDQFVYFAKISYALQGKPFPVSSNAVYNAEFI